MPTKKDYLKRELRHFDIKKHDVVPVIEDYASMAFQARNLYRASRIYDRMLGDRDCTVILTLAGSLFSAGLKEVVVDMVENDMVDAIVSTGALMVDQDFFEALGFKHYLGTPHTDDDELKRLHIDRIYDTYIDEDDLRVCDETVGKIADALEPRPYSSREFIAEMGRYLDREGAKSRSVVFSAFKKDVPIFVPAFSDSSAGFGLIQHQTRKQKHMSIDSAKDFLELTKVKLNSRETGLLMVGGGVPKNFAQDIVVAADILAEDAKMHKYAVQLTVADERDGGLSGSTLKEAHSWGKVDVGSEQMVFGEATINFSLLAAYAYHRGSWKQREARRLARIFALERTAPPVS
ncbi:MAG: deoxyhypusine synthase [Nitrososphaerota archaeon]|nr:deoxyhypusine synthase [Nitrososphaerota archaeon]MDG6990979.1 deoxyhypusine synthase [Nitrososphaerota archaeon]